MKHNLIYIFLLLSLNCFAQSEVVADYVEVSVETAETEQLKQNKDKTDKMKDNKKEIDKKSKEKKVGKQAKEKETVAPRNGYDISERSLVRLALCT